MKRVVHDNPPPPQLLKAADLRREFNYFKEKYASTTDSGGGGTTSTATTGPEDNDFGEFVRQRTKTQEQGRLVVLPPEDSLPTSSPIGKGTTIATSPTTSPTTGAAAAAATAVGATSSNSSPPSRLDEIYRRSVMKMHRRLGNMVKQRSSVKLPRQTGLRYNDEVRSSCNSRKSDGSTNGSGDGFPT